VTNQQDVGLTTNLVQSPLGDLSGTQLKTLDPKEKINLHLPVKLIGDLQQAPDSL
jgi:hypothetical protein